MDTQDILKSLFTLEQSLQGVESAKQQVEKTVAAYDSAKKQLTSLVQEFTNISTNLNTVITAIGRNQEQIGATLSSKIEDVFANINSKVTIVGDKALKINQTFETNCTKSAQTIKENVDAAVKSFNEKVQRELAEIVSTSSEIKAITNDIETKFRKDALSAASTFQDSLGNAILVFQEKSDIHLKTLSHLKDVLENAINLQRKLNAEVLAKTEAETASVKSAISNLDKQIKGTATNQIVNENTQTILSEITAAKAENVSIKKLVTVCLIATTISVILNVAMLIL